MALSRSWSVEDNDDPAGYGDQHSLSMLRLKTGAKAQGSDLLTALKLSDVRNLLGASE